LALANGSRIDDCRVTLVKTYESEKDVQMDIGDTVTMGPYTFKFNGVTSGARENYLYARGTFDVSRMARGDDDGSGEASVRCFER